MVQLIGMDLPAEPEARTRVELLGQTQGALQSLGGWKDLKVLGWHLFLVILLIMMGEAHAVHA